MGQIYKNIHKYVPRLGQVTGGLIEIGSSRPGDDQSTQYLHDLAQQLAINFVTCDINGHQVAALNAQGITAICQRGEDFIPNYPLDISIAYLDNFDWNWHPMATEAWTLVQIQEYRERYNVEMTNLQSQAAHVAQAVLIEAKTTANSIIAIDDTWFDMGWDTYQGKGGAAVPYLISKGYTVLETTNGRDGTYGIILGRFLSATAG
jgi:hypothetical protein